jgi:transcriptional regulator with XRE-family HTH domain
LRVLLLIYWQKANQTMSEEEELSERLARNIKQLREARSMTQQQLAKAAGIPRATWTNLESGISNPTLQVLTRVASALQVTLEELVSSPKASCQMYPNGSLPSRKVHQVFISKRLPDSVLGVDVERLEIPANSRLTGTPHTPGTREYLICETGQISLVAAGETWLLSPGDVVVFRGDQRHSYSNPNQETCIGYSVIVLGRIA